MLLLNILKNAFETYRNSFLINLLGSITLVSVVFLLYILIFPMLLKMPLNEFSQLAISQPEEMQKILLTPDFQVKMTLFLLLINCIIAPMEAGFYKVFDALKKQGRNQPQNPFFFLQFYLYRTHFGICPIVFSLKMGNSFPFIALGIKRIGFLFFISVVIIVHVNDSFYNI